MESTTEVPKQWQLIEDDLLVTHVSFFPRDIGWRITVMKFKKSGWKWFDEIRIWLISKLPD